MRLQNSISENIKSVSPNQSQNKQPIEYTPTFKAGALPGVLNFFGSTMQGIEDGGFLISFLIQDALGMTAPRVGAAFLRDKDITGEYNIQEGFEVLGREGLTGPCMMAVAPIMFLLAAKCGKATGVNSQLIKRYGNSLKEIVSKSDFDRALLNNKDKFKEEFFTKNIREMLENTLGKENVTDDSVKFVLDRISKYEKIPSDAVIPKNKLGIQSKNKYKNQCITDIVEHINNIKLSTSTELDKLDKLLVGSKNDMKTFSTREAIESMIKYSDDAITLNKNLLSLDEVAAENLKNSSIAKRFITNISTIAATLGVLSVLPRLYIRSNVSPGAKTSMQLKEAQVKEENTNKEDSVEKNDKVTFKGKGPKKSWLVKLGEKLSKIVDKDFFAKELEYNGHNFTNTLMAGLSLFGLLTPRGIKAYNRAQVDEDGKKDLTELWEILIRDISSSLSVVFAVPMLTRAAVTSYENKSGFVLMHKDRTKSKWATGMDLINPYSKTHVLTNTEIQSLYNGIDTKEKLINFCKYIDNNGGDLEKILSKSEHVNTIFNEKTMQLSDLSKLNRKEKNAKIISFFDNLDKGGKVDKKTLNEMITKLMKGEVTKPKSNKILGFARGLNSIPGMISLLVISPYILGWVIPRFTYANTRRIHEKKEQERQAKEAKATSLNTAV
ncbi:hypothetical protein IKB17_00310 [bacterium]|nr:hypothetical protein [bacterium]